MQHLKLYGLLAVFLMVAACTKEPELPTTTQQAEQHIQQAERKITEAEAEAETFVTEWIGTRSSVTVPAGSVDALADAVAEAGPGGTVILEEGLHTETATVVIDQRVKIEGEDGALLLFPNAPEPQAVPMEVVPNLHIRNTSRVWLKNFGILTGTDAAGRVGILIQEASRSRVEGLNIAGFQYGILLDGGDRSQFIGNTLDGVYPDYPSLVHWGLTISTGQRTISMRNSISNFAVGIF